MHRPCDPEGRDFFFQLLCDEPCAVVFAHECVAMSKMVCNLWGT